jgi:hypothetical protein
MDVLIGATGFVGQNYMWDSPATKPITREELNDSNRRVSCETLIIAAPSAEKWRANASPVEDLTATQRLVEKITQRFRPSRVLLFSTIDVYGTEFGANENSEPRPTTPYGENRNFFASQLQSTFLHTTLVRLPGLYGFGLKKNLLYDILNPRWEANDRFNPNSLFQWAEIRWAIRVAKTFLERDLRVRNIAVEPVSIADLPIDGAWRQKIDPQMPLIKYGMRTVETATGFLLSEEEVLNSLRAWLEPANSD